MQENVKMAFEFARDLSNQLITLSVGVLAFTVTFHKEYVKSIRPSAAWLLVMAWVSHLLAILAGIASTMALTGTLLKEIDANHPIGGNVRWFAGIQIILFVLGTLLIIIYGVTMLPEIRTTLVSKVQDTPERTAKNCPTPTGKNPA
jgi:hypothetical protein